MYKNKYENLTPIFGKYIEGFITNDEEDSEDDETLLLSTAEEKVELSTTGMCRYYNVYEFEEGEFFAETEGCFGAGYSNIYNKNKKTWANFPWIISEFGCGSGGSNSGELYRNQEQQAAWVRQMFDYFSNKENLDCMKRYTGVVWFNCNDVVGDLIENALYIDPVLTDTVAAFKEGFKKIKDKNYL